MNNSMLTDSVWISGLPSDSRQLTSFPEAMISRQFSHVISGHLHGTFLLKRARCVCGHNLGQNLHSLTLQVVPTYKILARQDTGSSTVWGRAVVEYWYMQMQSSFLQKKTLILWWNPCYVKIVFSKTYIFLNMKMTIVNHLFQEYSYQCAIKSHFVFPYLLVSFFILVVCFALSITSSWNSTNGQCKYGKDSNAIECQKTLVLASTFSHHRENRQKTPDWKNPMLIFE